MWINSQGMLMKAISEKFSVIMVKLSMFNWQWIEVSIFQGVMDMLSLS